MRGTGGADTADARAGAPAAEAEGGDADDEVLVEGGSAADAADEEAGADADAAGEEGVGDGVDTAAEDVAEVDADAAGEGGGVGEGVLDTADEDALDGFPPFFFVMVGCVWYLITFPI